jgi:hypothetical protein
LCKTQRWITLKLDLTQHFSIFLWETINANNKKGRLSLSHAEIGKNQSLSHCTHRNTLSLLWFPSSNFCNTLNPPFQFEFEFWISHIWLLTLSYLPSPLFIIISLSLSPFLLSESHISAIPVSSSHLFQSTTWINPKSEEEKNHFSFTITNINV